MTFGAYAALVLTQLALPYPVVWPSVLALGLVGGMLIERILIRRIVKAPEFTLVIATFAIGLLIKGALSLKFGDSPEHHRRPVRQRPDRRGGAALQSRRRYGFSRAPRSSRCW